MSETEFGQIWVSRRNFLQDFSVRYFVYIDGHVVGELPPYRTGRYMVPAGFHRVWAKRRKGLLKVWFPLNVEGFGPHERMEPCRSPIPPSSARTSSG